jgi:hypothetical protein
MPSVSAEQQSEKIYVGVCFRLTKKDLALSAVRADVNEDNSCRPLTHRCSCRCTVTVLQRTQNLFFTHIREIIFPDQIKILDLPEQVSWNGNCSRITRDNCTRSHPVQPTERLIIVATIQSQSRHKCWRPCSQHLFALDYRFSRYHL